MITKTVLTKNEIDSCTACGRANYVSRMTTGEPVSLTQFRMGKHHKLVVTLCTECCAEMHEETR